MVEYPRVAAAEVARSTLWQAHGSLADSLAFIRFARTVESGRVWAVRFLTDSRAIGSISWTRTGSEHGRIDYALSQAHWGRRVMTEAARAVIAAAFEADPVLARIESGGLASNLASQRVMAQCGMSLLRREMVYFLKFNEAREVVEYAVDRATFALLRG